MVAFAKTLNIMSNFLNNLGNHSINRLSEMVLILLIIIPHL